MITDLEQLTVFIANYTEIMWKQRDLSALDEFVNENASFHSLLGEVTGLDAIKGHLKRFQDSFVEMKVEVLEIIAQNDKVASHLRISGTGSKNFFGVDAHEKNINYEAAVFYQLENNKIQDCRVISDLYGMLTQVEAIPKILKPTRQERDSE